MDFTSVEGAANLPYGIPNLQVELHTTRLGVPIQWWRSVGSTHTAYAVEAFLDEWIDVVDVEAAFALREPITLERIKAERALAGMVLLKQSRLSVQPVKKQEFDAIVKLGGKAG